MPHNDEAVYAAIVLGLRESYPSVTMAQVAEIHSAWKRGKRGAQLPHGIIGRFVDDMLDEAVRAGKL